MPALPENVDLDPDGVSVWKSYILPAEEFALKKEAKVAYEAKYKDDVIGVRIVGGFLLDFYKYANIIETGRTPYKRMLLEIKMKLISRRFSSWALTIATNLYAYVSN